MGRLGWGARRAEVAVALPPDRDITRARLINVAEASTIIARSLVDSWLARFESRFNR